MCAEHLHGPAVLAAQLPNRIEDRQIRLGPLRPPQPGPVRSHLENRAGSGEAEEILQEVFLRVWMRAELYDPRLGGLTPWLVRLARNCAIDRLRARRIRDAASAAPFDESIADNSSSSTDIRSPETAVLDAERRGTVIDALAGLPPEQRRLIEAAFFEGYTHTELARRFELPLGTVKTRIRAGMIAMRQRMEHTV